MLVCSTCNAAFPETEPRWRCECGAYLMLRHDEMFSPADLASRPCSLWRYREPLAISGDPVTLGEGFTPLVDGELAERRVSLKLDFLCPSGSYKDRGGAVMLSKLKEWGVSEILEDSSGNAGASIASYAALAGIRARIFIPSSTSAGKAAQIEMYGAHLEKIPGSREDAARAAWEAAGRIFYASHNWSPYFLAGMKTAAYEIAEQRNWQPPDWVITPAGGGGLLLGLYLGFADLLRAGITHSMPRLAAVQSEGCDPIYHAWAAGLDDIPARAKRPTAAEGISVAQPVRGKDILQAIRGSNGVVRVVSDDTVWETLESLGRLGVYVEPTSAAAPGALSGLVRDGVIAPHEDVVIFLTGSGLKATDKIVEHAAVRHAVLA